MVEEAEFRKATVTCTTSGCWNENLPIHLPVVGLVICGGCSQPIEDVTYD